MPVLPHHESRFARAAVVGAGTMGAGIAQVLAAAGLDVTLVDTDAAALGRASERLGVLLSRMKDSGELAMASSIADIPEPAAVDVAIEAVTENLAVKREVVRALDAALGPEAIIATNTSSLSVTEIASAAKRPERVCGMHFMNPAPVRKRGEVVRAERTSSETVARAKALCERIEKTPVVCADTPGFVVNRVLTPMLNEAARALESGAATAESIDLGMKLGARFPMGPLHLADLIGIDVVVAELREFEKRLGTAYAPSVELVSRAERGELGRKTGRGLFEYRSGT